MWYSFTPDNTYQIDDLPERRGFTLIKGKTYVVSQAHAEAIQASGAFKGVLLRLTDGPSEFNANYAPEGKKILISLMGGLGDVVCMAPLLRMLQRKKPASLDIVCQHEAQSILQASGILKTYRHYPLTLDKFMTYDAVFEDLRPINYPEFTTHTTAEIYAGYWGIAEWSKPMLSGWRLTRPSNKHHPRSKIGLQIQASHSLKSYPIDKWRDLIALLRQRNMEIHLLGAPGQLDDWPDDTNIINHSKRGESVEDTARTLQTLDLVIAPDSLIMHMAGALDVPGIILLGLFPAKLRTKPYPSLVGIEPKEIHTEFWRFEPQFTNETLRENPHFSKPEFSTRTILGQVVRMLRSPT